MLHTPGTGQWLHDWIWGIALVAASVAVHAAGLAIIALGLSRIFGPLSDRMQRAHYQLIVFSLVLGISGTLLALLHGLEAALWAATYVGLGAAGNFDEAIYFSLQMATTLGTDVIQLAPGWWLMGPLEAMSGMLLFGLSTAFLLAVVQRAWPFRGIVGGPE